MSSGRVRLSTWLIAAGLLLVVAGLAAHLSRGAPPTAPATPHVSRTSDSPAPTAGATPQPKRAAWQAGAPRRVIVSALGIDAPVVPITTVGNTLVPPSDPKQLGWWAEGAKPGADKGSALVTGHTVNAGGGALDDLENLERGDRVTVRTDRGRVAYAVERVRIYSKGSVANHAERLFSQTVDGRLVLITCEDWNGEIYLSNVVVTASPLSTR